MNAQLTLVTRLSMPAGALALRRIHMILMKDGRKWFPSRATYSAGFHFVYSYGPHSGVKPEWIAVVKEFDEVLGNPCQAFSPNLAKLIPSRTLVSDPQFLRWLRQLLRLGWKIDSGAIPDDPFNAQFLERISRSGSPERGNGYYLRVIDIVNSLFQKIPIPSLAQLNCKHGPGAVSTGERGLKEKMEFRQYYRQLIPLGGLSAMRLNENHMLDEPTMSCEKFAFTKVVAVPKDARGPRIISEEPCTLQFLQQGMWNYLVPFLTRLAPEINFSDQIKHRELLHERRNSSIDLTDASDFVSRRLVYQCLPPLWRNVMFRLRSSFAVVDKKGVFPIRAFAPMGSALCFPMEAIIHWACVKAAYLDVSSHLRGSLGSFSVYGDDLIVNGIIAGSVLSALRGCGLKPNLRKCYINTPFRESCGLDLYLSPDGSKHDITPTYLRYPIEDMTRITAAKLSIAQVNLYNRGFTTVAEHLRDLVLERIPLPCLPLHIDPPIFLYLRDEVVKNIGRRRMHFDEQRQQILTWVLEPRTHGVVLDGWPGLFAALGFHQRASYRTSEINKLAIRWVPVHGTLRG